MSRSLCVKIRRGIQKTRTDGASNPSAPPGRVPPPPGSDHHNEQLGRSAPSRQVSEDGHTTDCPGIDQLSSQPGSRGHRARVLRNNRVTRPALCLTGGHSATSKKREAARVSTRQRGWPACNPPSIAALVCADTVPGLPRRQHSSTGRGFERPTVTKSEQQTAGNPVLGDAGGCEKNVMRCGTRVRSCPTPDLWTYATRLIGVIKQLQIAKVAKRKQSGDWLLCQTASRRGGGIIT